jgi:O-antigen/teichoic acid export membrane protein
MRVRVSGALPRRRLLLRTVASVAQTGAQAASVVVSLLAVHFAGISTWGVFLGAMILVRLCAQVANFGTRDHLLGEFARDPGGMRVAWRRNVAARAWLLVLGPAVFLVAGADLPRAVAMTAWLVGLFVAQSYDSVVTYRRTFALAFRLEVGGTGLIAGLIVVRGTALTADDLILAFALVAVLKATALAVRFPSFRPIVGLPDIPELRRAWSFFMLTFSGAVQGRVDLYVVAVLLPPADLGAYGVLTNFVLLTQSLSGALLAPIVPLLYRLSRAGVWRSALRLFAMGVPVTLAAAALTLVCLELLYGIHPSPLTIVAAWAAMLPPFLFTPLVYYQFRRRRARLVVYGSFLGTAVSIAGTFALAPGLGIAGAMVAAALAQLSIAMFHVGLFRRHATERNVTGET